MLGHQSGEMRHPLDMLRINNLKRYGRMVGHTETMLESIVGSAGPDIVRSAQLLDIA